MTYASDWSSLLGRADVFIVDTETTGLDETAELVQIAALDTTGQAVGNQFCLPADPVPEAASRVHGLTNERLAAKNAQRFPAFYPSLVARLQQAEVLLAWNADFDSRIFKQTCIRYGLPVPNLPWRCTMQDYKEMTGAHHRPKLQFAAEKLQYPRVQTHTALSDCRMVLHVMRHCTSAHIDRERARNQARRRRGNCDGRRMI